MLRKVTYLFLAGALISLSACDSFGPDDDARMNVLLGGSGSARLAAVVLDDGAGGSLPISMAAVDSINIRITSIEAVRRGEGNEENRVTLSLSDSGKARINLLRLPSADSQAWRLARGEIPAGTYTGVRIRFDMATATITLNQEVTVGNQVYAAGTYALEVPSGEQNGIKLPFANITIGEDATADVVLTFDGTTTVHTIATGSGKLKISPVLHTRVAVDED